MLQTLSTLTVLILIAGFLLRNRRPIHIRLMITAFAIDLGLVLAIEMNRGAIRKVASGPSPLLAFHVLINNRTVVLRGDGGAGQCRPARPGAVEALAQAGRLDFWRLANGELRYQLDVMSGRSLHQEEKL